MPSGHDDIKAGRNERKKKKDNNTKEEDKRPYSKRSTLLFSRASPAPHKKEARPCLMSQDSTASSKTPDCRLKIMDPPAISSGDEDSSTVQETCYIVHGILNYV